ncbi:MAG TPA: histidinol dehydrogenase [Rhodobacteraceae bacterium]|nr:histidinol dehydrogenase [Paracoccaceae bacterium]
MKADQFAPIAVHELSAMSKAQIANLHIRTEGDLSGFLDGAKPIIDAVRQEGDAALVRFARQFDKAELTESTVEASKAEFDRAFDSLDRQLIETLEYAADNIRRFHEEQMPKEMWMKEIRPGVLVGERYNAIDSAALYSPRGKGSFPSVTLMTTIPAIVAGVREPIVVTPPAPDGTVDAATLVAARLAGVERVFKAGGAVAVAAAAFGTESVPKCQKIEGPGSLWVVAAKRLLSGEIASHVRAGPTESVLLVDKTANPRTAALDLLIEAEHGPDSSVFLVTPSADIAKAVTDAVPEFYQHMDTRRVEFATTVLSGKNGGVVVTRDIEEAYQFVNDYAPEHLQVLSKNPFDHLAHIENASEILLGENLPSSIANYVMGPNAVLPTSGAARFGSPLGVHDFLKSASIGHISPAGYAEMARHTNRFASYEGFDAHRNAVSDLRLQPAT